MSSHYRCGVSVNGYYCSGRRSTEDDYCGSGSLSSGEDSDGVSRGSIAFFSSYRPPVALDIFCRPVDPRRRLRRCHHHGDVLHLTDGESYNYNCQPIVAPEALSAIARRLDYLGRRRAAVEDDIDSGRLTGLVFVSERDRGLETLHVALHFAGDDKAQVFSLAEVFGHGAFGGTRLEDSGCIAGGFDDDDNYYLVYVSTKEPVSKRRSPWNVVYKTNLGTGKTKRLTPHGTSDLSPAVSEDGQYVAVASFQGKEWDGEISDLKTDIYVINLQNPHHDRKLVIKNGGWPSWGGDDVIFFHRKERDNWGVFRYSLSSRKTVRVTPASFNAVTPAAIDEDRVAVATIRRRSTFADVRAPDQYRHIEVFDVRSLSKPLELTRHARPKADHFNPFVLDGGDYIGYHRCKSEQLRHGDGVPRHFHTLQSPHDDVSVFRVSGVFPTFSKDGSKLAFVDNEFKSIWLADDKGLRIVFQAPGPDAIFSPVWNQTKDTLYVCMGPSFKADAVLEIHAIDNVSKGRCRSRPLTVGGFNNAFPSTNPDGTKFVFRSTRDGGKTNYYKNLYIMEDADAGEAGRHGSRRGAAVTRLTTGNWTDTHCQWSPNGDLIVFSSNRDKPHGAPPKDHGLDPGYFAVYLMDVATQAVVRVIRSGLDLAGHVNHPVFSADGRSIAVTSDLAAVSADPMSLPVFLHSVRPYGDIFTVDIDPKDLEANEDVEEFTRVTHSRYENSTPSWTAFAADDPHAKWNALVVEDDGHVPACPYTHPDGGQSWHMTGQIIIPKRHC
ncbi:unnamed protein product [Urochloa humidicola]